MARTKKASNNRQNRKTVKEPQSRCIIVEFANNEAVSSTPIGSLGVLGNNGAIETSPGTTNIDDKSDTKKPRRRRTLSSTIMANSDRPSSSGESFGRSLHSKDKNVSFAGVIDEAYLRNNTTNESNSSAITDDLHMSGVSALLTEDSEASSVIDLTDSINKTAEKIAVANDGGQQQGSATARRKSLRKPLKRLALATTPRYDMAKERTSKGTPYIRKVTSSNNRNLVSEMKLSTGKKERISEEIKKNGNVKRVTFNSSPAMKTLTAASQRKPHGESTSKKQSTVKIPNFHDIHTKMFEKMESIDVTVRKREERMKAAASSRKKGIKGSSQVKKDDTSTKPKKVVRKLDNWQTVPAKISQAGDSKAIPVPESSKSVRSKSLRSAPKVEVLQELSNCRAVFKFTGNSDSNARISSTPAPLSNVVKQLLLPGKKTAEDCSTRRQQAYKARPAPKTDPRNSNRLRGVRLNRRFELQMKYREDQNELHLP